MNEKDLEQIEKLLTRKLDEKLDEKLDSKLREMSATFDRKLDAVSEMLSKELRTGLAESERRIENQMIVLEKKVDLVIENQQAQLERVDRMELVQRENNHSFDRRISNVAADLATHKADPDAHQRGYSVKEGEETFVYAEPEREE